MLDPKEFFAACREAQELGQRSSAMLAESFMSGVSDMSVASSGNASKVIDNVMQVGQKMFEQMATLKESVDKQVAAHQDAQQRAKTYDFNVNMSDLRPTESVGFPQEMPQNFFAPFKTGGK